METEPQIKSVDDLDLDSLERLPEFSPDPSLSAKYPIIFSGQHWLNRARDWFNDHEVGCVVVLLSISMALFLFLPNFNQDKDVISIISISAAVAAPLVFLLVLDPLRALLTNRAFKQMEANLDERARLQLSNELHDWADGIEEVMARDITHYSCQMKRVPFELRKIAADLVLPCPNRNHLSDLKRIYGVYGNYLNDKSINKQIEKEEIQRYKQIENEKAFYKTPEGKDMRKMLETLFDKS